MEYMVCLHFGNRSSLMGFKGWNDVAPLAVVVKVSKATTSYKRLLFWRSFSTHNQTQTKAPANSKC